ncbi:hypothetical protein [Lampropedia aestuarii]|uniref:hypothetical protein n=1 Tax=Lampropedia aestuarii TaxID=2562762 RepID=UPI00246924D2|nr:hypothetical protein [Lampropedia aestuarii]MDH5857806.1 hypothetical protein [Lampropedia aestuarii]
MPNFSTGLRNGMLYNIGFTTAMSGGVLKIFSGPVPTNADAAETGTLLATITGDGDAMTGLSFATPEGAILSKDPDQVWRTNSISESGQATYFRLVANEDDGLENPASMRVQGSIANAGADMNVTSTTFTAGQPWTLNYFNLAFPTGY